MSGGPEFFLLSILVENVCVEFGPEHDHQGEGALVPPLPEQRAIIRQVGLSTWKAG